MLIYGHRNNPAIQSMWQNSLEKPSIQEEVVGPGSGEGGLLSCPTLLGDMDTNPGDFISCFLSSSLPGTPVPSQQGTFKRLWLDTKIMEAVEISTED